MLRCTLSSVGDRTHCPCLRCKEKPNQSSKVGSAAQHAPLRVSKCDRNSGSQRTFHHPKRSIEALCRAMSHHDVAQRTTHDEARKRHYCIMRWVFTPRSSGENNKFRLPPFALKLRVLYSATKPTKKRVKVGCRANENSNTLPTPMFASFRSFFRGSSVHNERSLRTIPLSTVCWIRTQQRPAGHWQTHPYYVRLQS